MPFFTPPSTKFVKHGLSVSVAYRNRQTTRKTQLMMEIRIGRGVIEQLGWAFGERAKVLWGDGPDFGSICLRRSEDGALIAQRDRTTGRSAMVTSGKVPYDPIPDKDGALWHFEREIKRNAIESVYRIVGDELIIYLPSDWFTLAPLKKTPTVKPKKNSNPNHQRRGDWEAVDNGPRWSHAMVEKYDEQLERRRRNP